MAVSGGGMSASIWSISSPTWLRKSSTISQPSYSATLGLYLKIQGHNIVKTSGVSDCSWAI